MSLQQFWDQYVISPKEVRTTSASVPVPVLNVHKQRYRLTGTLIGHGAAINCLAFLQHDVLASGGHLRVLSSQFHLTSYQAMIKLSASGTFNPRK